MSAKPDLLEHAVELFPPPDDAFDRLVGLRDRRRRTRQLAALAFTLLLLAAAVGGAIVMVRSTGDRVPAEPSPTSLGRLEAVPIGMSFSGLTAAADGTLWWGEPGLTRFDPATGSARTLTAADDPAFEGAGPISSARDGGVWMVAPDATVRRVDGEGFQEVIDAPGVSDVLEGPDGSLYGVGCEGGCIVHREGQTWVSLPNDGRPDSSPGLGAFDASGALWVGNDRFPGPEGMGVSRFDGTRWTTWTTRDGLPSDDIYAIEIGPDGDAWVGTDRGVARFTRGRWVAYPPSETGIWHVRSLLVTDTDVWIAGFGGDGAARFDGTAWVPVTIERADASGSLGIQYTGTASSAWATVNDALYRLEGSTWRLVSRFDGPVGLGEITALSGDEVWLAAWSVGAWRLDGGTWTHFPKDVGSGATDLGWLNGIVVDRDGTAWAASTSGLARFDGEAWETVSFVDRVAIALEPGGALWTAWEDPEGPIVGPVGGSPIREPVPLGQVRTLGVVSDRDVWAGTGGYLNGLAHFDGSGWTSVTPVEGHPDFGVADIEVAPSGDVWVSLVLFDPARPNALDPLAVARFDGQRWTVFQGTDGVPFGNTNEGAGSLEIMPDGAVLLTASPGLLEFRDGEWALVQAGRFSQVSAAPDGTLWLAGDGLFRLPPT
jgi:ligand-binding sensor domain-containing protein